MTEKETGPRMDAIEEFERTRAEHPEDFYGPEETNARFETMLRACAYIPPKDEAERQLRRDIVADMDKGGSYVHDRAKPKKRGTR